MQKIEIVRKPLRSGLFGGHRGGSTDSNMGWPQRKLYKRHGSRWLPRRVPGWKPEQGRERARSNPATSAWHGGAGDGEQNPLNSNRGQEEKNCPGGHQPELRPLAMKSNRRN